MRLFLIALFVFCVPISVEACERCFQIVNQQRAARGLPLYRYSARLTRNVDVKFEFLPRLQVLANPVPAFDVGHANIEFVSNSIQRISLAHGVAKCMQGVARACLANAGRGRQFSPGPDHQFLADA